LYQHPNDTLEFYTIFLTKKTTNAMQSMKDLFILLLTIVLASLFLSSCNDKINEIPALPNVILNPYFMDVEMKYPWDSTNYSLDRDFYANYLISRKGEISELYSVTGYIDNASYTESILEGLENEFGYVYGTVSYDDLGIGFFHPESGVNDGIWTKEMVDGLFQEGKTFAFGQGAGQVEVGYFKNHLHLGEGGQSGNSYKGYLTVEKSNDTGYFRITKTEEGQSGGPAMSSDTPSSSELTNGLNVWVEYDCLMYQQYNEDQFCHIKGEGLLFIPYEEE
jgi:hypothetical protein